MVKMRWILIAGLIVCGSATANDAEKFKQAYAGKPYAEARAAIIAEGWVPFKPVAAPVSTPSAYRTFPEFDNCENSSCHFAFERAEEILEISTTVMGDLYSAGIDPKNRYVEIMTGRAEKAKAEWTQKVQALQVAAAKPAVTDEQCLKAAISTYIFLTRAGVRDSDPQFNPLLTLIKNGSYTFEKAYVQNGSCFQQIHVNGVYLGTSYNRLLTGEVM
jgi:hypothetical protein